MSSAGHILDMINRQQRNRDMQEKRRGKYRSKMDLFSYQTPSDRIYNSEKFKIVNDISQQSKSRPIKGKITLGLLGLYLIGFIVIVVLTELGMDWMSSLQGPVY